MAINRGHQIDPADVQAVFTLANSKLPTVSPAYGDSGDWLYEMSRVRAALSSAIQYSHIDQITTGPWGIDCTHDTIFGTGNLRAYGYAFPDNGADVTVTSNAGLTSATVWNELCDGAYRANVNNGPPEESHVTITIGGDTPGRLYTPNTATNTVFWHIYQLMGGGPFDSSKWTLDTDLPGVTFCPSNRFVPWVTIDATVDPGEYYLHLTNNQPTDCSLNYFGDLSVQPVGYRDGLLFTLSNSAKSDWNAIHSTLSGKIVKAPETPEGEMPFGIWAENLIYPDGISATPVWNTIDYFWNVTPNTLGGIWLAHTAPLPTLTTEIIDRLPPNIPSTTVPPVLPVQKRATPGAGGTVEPVQPCITYRPGRFPSMRDTENAPTFNYTNMSGLCILDVLVRRIPVNNGNGIYLPPTSKPEQEVSLGCMRGGTFTLFQTVTIPAGDDEVRIHPLWPVFSANALVYQSASPALVCAIPFDTTAVVYPDAGIDPVNHANIRQWLPMEMDYPVSASSVQGIVDILNSM